ncbi:hypothetical protein BDV95DRAFT_507498 [Massariosphaeria phaeospora]|uniref:Peptidase S54 rhomboid domain-containing protein n=1 Tax=Massariosphaeria phaeospora TaxID=100035 RepID=A0A7C8MEP8_9PLEO|nr:hypothetical protein BDV95DRAFT_507498 [Massariosphaeria phaeospora]
MFNPSLVQLTSSSLANESVFHTSLRHKSGLKKSTTHGKPAPNDHHRPGEGPRAPSGSNSGSKPIYPALKRPGKLEDKVRERAQKSTNPPQRVSKTANQRQRSAENTEEAVQRRILKHRIRILVPGIWALSAVVGIYTILAYLDSRFGAGAPPNDPSSSPWNELPRTLLLTPKVVMDGLQIGWTELDKLTIGLVVLNVAVHLMKRSPLKFWEKLPHIAGEKHYTLLTYVFAHSSWAHLASNIFGICWVLPSVVRLFDDDIFHASALYLSVPVVVGYLSNFGFRWGWIKGIPINMGGSTAIFAVFGAYCMAYPHEKVWFPTLGIFRLEAMTWAALLVVMDGLRYWSSRGRSKSRPAYATHVICLGLGAAYVYFDCKNNVWVPLKDLFSKRPLPRREQADLAPPFS